MNTKYAILNPSTGEYSFANDKDELVNLLTETAMNFYKLHVHGNIYSVVQTNSDGSETWTSPDGDALIAPAYDVHLKHEYNRQIGTTIL